MGRLPLVVWLGALGACSDPAAMPDAPMPDGRPASVTITPAAFFFGDAEIGVDLPSHPFTITNALPEPVDVSSIAAGGTQAADFVVTENDCPATLAPAQSCKATVQFSPGAGTDRTADLAVTTGFDVVTAQLLGRGFVKTARLVFDPGSQNLGDIPIGATSDPADIHVLNEATAAMFTVSFTGPNAASFDLISTDCNTAVVPLHGTCSARVGFHADHGGEHVANLTLSTDAASWSAGLLGHSSTPFLVSPFSGAFGSMLVGQSEQGELRTFTVMNTTDPNGGATSGTLTPTLIGPAASEFSVESTDCTTLAPGQTCSVAIRFAASTRGTKAAELVVTDGTSGQAGHVTLGASGYTVFIATLPQLPATSVGQTTTKTFSIVNPSDHDTGAISLGITGSSFAIGTTTCSGVLAAHTGCTVDVQFSPTSTGMKTATLTASASPGASHSVTLTGTGQ